MSAQVLVVHSDGTTALATSSNLSDLQRLVRGFIQVVPLPNRDVVAYCNEDGRMAGLVPNRAATTWWHEQWTAAGHDPQPDHDLVGTVIIAGDNGSGTEVDCPAHVLSNFRAERAS